MNPMEDWGVLTPLNPEPAYALFRWFYYGEQGKGEEENHGQWNWPNMEDEV